jgi:hypothetical protein
VPAPMDGNAVPLVQPMVAAFGLVCHVKNIAHVADFSVTVSSNEAQQILI